MRTERILSEAQQARIRAIDERIELLNKEIFELCMQRNTIEMLAPVKYIAETAEEEEQIRNEWWMRNTVFGRSPFIPDAVCVIKNTDKED